MGEATKIQWCDHTFNSWIGCSKVSPGCARCYAEHETLPRVKRSKGQELWGKGKQRHRTSEANWKQPLKWNRLAEKFPFRCPLHGAMQCEDCPTCECENERNRPRVFCASLADWLDHEVPIEWLTDLLKLIHDTPNLDWLLLSKRPENWRQRVNTAMDAYIVGAQSKWDEYVESRQSLLKWLEQDEAPQNIWAGVSIEDQKRADERIPLLLQIPARVRFLSVEPLLSGLDLSQWLQYDKSRANIHGIHRSGLVLSGRSGPDLETLSASRGRGNLRGADNERSGGKKQHDDKEGKISAGHVHCESETDESSGSSNSVDGSQSSRDSGCAGDQSPRRESIEQSAGKLGGGDEVSSHRSHVPSPQAEAEAAVRREQRERESNRSGGIADSGIMQSGSNAAARDRKDVRDKSSDSLGNRDPQKLGIHWVIFGGESGPGARPCNIEWIRDGVKQCRAAGVAPFVKQLGSKAEALTDNGVTFDMVLREKKGGDMSEWPEDLRIMEFPK